MQPTPEATGTKRVAAARPRGVDMGTQAYRTYAVVENDREGLVFCAYAIIFISRSEYLQIDVSDHHIADETYVNMARIDLYRQVEFFDDVPKVQRSY